MTDTSGVTIHLGDCIETMRNLPESSVDSIVTDPPYGLGFMGKEWDSLPPGEEWARECLRVLKPGGHMLAFGGSRTWHRLAVAIEDAGFEVRDSIAWLYGSGFPKSLDMSKAIDKAAGAEREVIGRTVTPFKVDAAASRGTSLQGSVNGDFAKQQTDDGYRYTEHTAPATPAAEQWQGWGTALKPAFEPIVVARKPLTGTVAANVLAHGTGALNIDACRVEGGERPLIISKSEDSTGILGNGLNGSSHGGSTTAGRWPANVVLDESQAAALDEQSGPLHTQDPATRYRASDPAWSPSGTARGTHRERKQATGGLSEKGTGASRFFYVAKAPAKERPKVDGVAHPTVKPLTLMRWLVRLVTPPGGTVLEPFAGSGTTVEAAALEGFNCIAIEREASYLPLIHARLERVRDAQPQPDTEPLFDLENIA